jgi:hypothetical protein
LGNWDRLGECGVQGTTLCGGLSGNWRIDSSTIKHIDLPIKDRDELDFDWDEEHMILSWYPYVSGFYG